MRHGRSEGNEEYKKIGDKSYFDISLKDAPLSKGGIQQCLDSDTKTYLEQLDFTTIVVSPLRRCLQTAYYLLKDHPKFNDMQFVVMPYCREHLHTSADIPRSFAKT